MVKTVATLDDLCKELREVFDSDRVNIEEVKSLMESYKSNPKEWRKFAKFDQHRYTRNLVDEGNGKYNLMILCWNESQGSSIHAHSKSHCFLKVLLGTVKEEQFEWPSDAREEAEMNKKEEAIYGENSVTYINDSIGLHRMENHSHSDKAVTLHLYSPPFRSCKTFDERTGHMSVAPMTFWSKYGKKIPQNDPSTQDDGVIEVTENN
ncbi:cysteine dioxygenase type 1 [Octopus sinensis]|uniref:Cysteine dioxygenase n=1 Tax=Octopus sinensis TaxID=2607531 RepID=A0A6P7T6P3_9MOLL|nr:cysteine dioxygenase type 1 [Octopus sinensis]